MMTDRFVQQLRYGLLLVSCLAMLYALCTWMIGPRTIVDWFLAVTAIDHWHPNWPGEETAWRLAETLQNLALPAVAVCVILIILTTPLGTSTRARAQRWAGEALGRAVLARGPKRMSSGEFRDHVASALCDMGLDEADAYTTVDEAMSEHATSDEPSEWADSVRARALELRGFSGGFVRALTNRGGLGESARFLSTCGYPALQVTQVGQAEDVLDFDGLAVMVNDEYVEYDSNAVELLFYAQRAHVAALRDGSDRGSADRAPAHVERLRSIATKMSLRGFVPLELGGDRRMVSPEDLERWALCKVLESLESQERAALPAGEECEGS